MAQQLIDLGAAPNDGTGDSLRVAGEKINENFTELYSSPSGGVQSVTGDGVGGTTDDVILTFPTPGDIGAEVAGAAATVAGNLAAHISDTSDAHAGTAISNTPAGNITATTTQAAIDELDTEKQPALVSGTNIKTVNGTSLLGAGDLGVIDVTHGGTSGTDAQSAFDNISPAVTQGDLIYNNGTNNVRLPKNTSPTRYLSNTGTTNNPAWAQVDLSNGVTGTLPAGSVAVAVDGVTVTGDGTTGDPLVASGLQSANNLSDVAAAGTARANIAASHDRTTITDKSSAFTPALADFAGVQPLYRCTASFDITLPSNTTQAIPIGKVFFGVTTAGDTTTFIPDSGVTTETSSGGYTVTPNGTADFVFWSCTKRDTNTWFVQIGSPPATSPFCITFLASTSTFTNMPAGVQEIAAGTTGRFRSKADLTNYQQVRVTVGVSTVGSTNAGFYLQYSTDDSTFIDIGTASGSDIAVISGSVGTKASGWVNLPSGAKADVFLRIVGISGDATADPVVGNITAQFR